MEPTIRSFFDSAVKESPLSYAMEYLNAGKRVRVAYSQLDTRVRDLAELFAARGVRPRTSPVGLILENGPEWVEILLALAGTAIPVVPMDPKFRPAEFLYILKDSRCSAIVTDPAHIPILEKILPDLPDVRNILIYSDVDQKLPIEICGIACIPIRERAPIYHHKAISDKGRYASTTPEPDDVAVIIYTSGSTGKPKGSLLTNANIATDAIGVSECVRVLRRHDRFLVVLPFFHAFSFTTNLILSTYLHGRLQFVTSLRTITEDMKRFSPSAMMAVPLMVEKIAAKIENNLETNRRMLLLRGLFGSHRVVRLAVRRSLGGRLKLLVVGGAPCPVGVLTQMRHYGIGIIEGYGLTEAAPVVSMCAPEDLRVGSIGVPLPNIEVKVENPDEHGVGELLVRGPIVMKGYLGMPEATAETLKDGWLHTGDLVMQDGDGYLTIRGRLKALIVNREGKNIYPEEVEQCIGRDPLIRDVLVLGYHEPGEIGERVGAIVVPNLDLCKDAGGELLPKKKIEALVRAAVQTQCGDLATYKHPRKIDIRMEPLQRTSIQKIARKAYQGQLDRAT